jgi:hypothetical protein
MLSCLSFLGACLIVFGRCMACSALRLFFIVFFFSWFKTVRRHGILRRFAGVRNTARRVGACAPIFAAAASGRRAAEKPGQTTVRFFSCPYFCGYVSGFTFLLIWLIPLAAAREGGHPLVTFACSRR